MEFELSAGKSRGDRIYFKMEKIEKAFPQFRQKHLPGIIWNSMQATGFTSKTSAVNFTLFEVDILPKLYYLLVGKMYIANSIWFIPAHPENLALREMFWMVLFLCSKSYDYISVILHITNLLPHKQVKK